MINFGVGQLTSKKIVLIAIASLFIAVAYSQKTQAITDNYNNVPAFIRNSLAADQATPPDCNNYKHRQDQWISAAGNNSVRSITVSQGTTSVNLWLNLLASHCNVNIDWAGNIMDKSISTTRHIVNSRSASATSGPVTPTFSVTGLNAGVNYPHDLNYGASHLYNDRYVKGANNGPYFTAFSLSGLGSLTPGTYTVTVVVSMNIVNSYTDGTEYCIVPNADGSRRLASSLNDLNCGDKISSFDIQLVIPNEEPALNSITATCDSFVVNATTVNGSSYAASLIVDGVEVGIVRSNIPSGQSATFDEAGQWKDFSTHRFRVRVMANNGSGAERISADRNVGPCIQFACGASPLTMTPTNPEVGTPFSVTARFATVRSGTATITPMGSRAKPYEYHIRLQISGLLPGTEIGSGFIGTGSDSVQATRGGLTATSLTTYDASTSIRNLTGSANLVVCNDPSNDITSSRKPYFRVFNGDVAAGSQGCPVWPKSGTSSGGIIAFSKGNRNGAGTQLMAQALAVINGFSSAQAVTTATNDKSLTLANNAGNVFGGSFGAGTCPPNYFGAAASGPTSALPPSWGSTDGTYYLNSGSTIPTTTIAMGKKIRIYVDGDVSITGATNTGITFQNPTGWGSIDDIPSFVLIARNIYIHPAVNQLDGIYIAQPNSGTGGVVYTCSDGGTAPPSEAIMGLFCTIPLKVYGSVIAKTIKLLRTNGTVNNATANELPGAGTDNAAERFIYSPEVWLRAPDLENLSNNSFDGLISQPPVL